MGRNRRHDIVKPSKYKTSMCTFFVSAEGCPFGDRCAFAHGEAELREEPKDVAPPADAVEPPHSRSEDEPAADGANSAPAPSKECGPSSVRDGATKPAKAKADGSGADSSAPKAGAGRERNNGKAKSRQTPPLAPPGPALLGPGAVNGSAPMGYGTGAYPAVAGMPYSTNNAVPNAPLYIPTNMALHPFLNVNNSHQYLNVLSEGPSAGGAGVSLGPAGSCSPPPFLMYDSAAKGGAVQAVGASTSAVNPHGGSSRPPARGHGFAVSRNTLANAGGSRGGRGGQQGGRGGQQGCMPGYPLAAGQGLSASQRVLMMPSSFAPLSQGGDGGVAGQGGRVSMDGPTLRTLMTSAAPPTVVHIPFDGSGGWGGAALPSSDLSTFPSAAATQQQLNTLLRMQGTGSLPFGALPTARGLDELAPLPNATMSTMAPLQAQAPLPQTLSLENLLATLGRHDGGASAAKDDDETASEATDWTAFLDSWMQQPGGGSVGASSTTSTQDRALGKRPVSAPKEMEADSGVRTIVVPAATSSAALAVSKETQPSPPPAPAGVPDAPAPPRLPEQLTSAQPSALQPITLCLKKPVVQLSDSAAAPAASPAPASTGAAAPSRPRRPLLCAVSRAGVTGSGTPGSAPARAAAERRRVPVMRNCFRSSCITKEEEQQSSGSLLLYSAEKNTLYYITAPANAREADSKAASKTASDGVAAEKESAAPERSAADAHVDPTLPAGGDTAATAATSVSQLTGDGIRCRPPQRRFRWWAPEENEAESIEYCI